MPRAERRIETAVPDEGDGTYLRKAQAAVHTRPMLANGASFLLGLGALVAGAEIMMRGGHPDGLSIFTVLALATTVGLAVWGMRRAAVGGRAAR